MKRLKSEAQQDHDSKPPSAHQKGRIPWSKQLAKKDAKEKRRTQKAKKRGVISPAPLCQERSALKRTRAEGEEKRVGSIESEDDWALLAEEERLAKKLRKGKISEAEFDIAAFSNL